MFIFEDLVKEVIFEDLVKEVAGEFFFTKISIFL
jgi:hypothetical protein